MPAKKPDASPATPGTAPAPSCPAISTTRTPRACWPRRATPPTSRLPKAAIIPAPSASFRSCAASSAPAPSPSVVTEAERLAAQGVREINLIGQDTTCFGEDLGTAGRPRRPARTARANRRRSAGSASSTPIPTRSRRACWRFSPRHPRLCRYIDVPLQHASTAVLKRMKRGGSAEIFLKLIAKMRQAVPDLTLRTSFIVGFPGETEDDFQQLCDFVTAAQFDWLGVFAYSDEEGSPAFLLDGQSAVPRKSSAAAASSCSCRSASAASAASSGLAARSKSCSKAPARRPICSGRRALRPTPRRSTARSSSTISESTQSPQPGSFHRAIVEEAHDYDLVARLL